MGENEILMNRGSGINIEGGVVRLAIEGENVIAENKSGLGIRLEDRAMAMTISVTATTVIGSRNNNRTSSLDAGDFDDSFITMFRIPVIRGRIGGEWGEMLVRQFPTEKEVTKLLSQVQSGYKHYKFSSIRSSSSDDSGCFEKCFSCMYR